MVRLGLLGMSEGNGHPYSWSAICNGYDRDKMEDCGFSAIPRYLEKRQFPDDRLPNVRVTHLWTQDPKLSRHIAQATFIDQIVDCFQQMIGSVDGILLARDDAENHYELASIFLDAGLPIFVDKPLAYSLSEAKRLLAAQKYPGQLFSCSALRFAREFRLTRFDLQNIGTIRRIEAVTPKCWEKYAVHVIEPAICILQDRGRIVEFKGFKTKASRSLLVTYETGVELMISSVSQGCSPIAIRIYGTLGWKDLVFEDSYSAFYSALSSFVQSIKAPHQTNHFENLLEVIEIIEAGIEL